MQNKLKCKPESLRVQIFIHHILIYMYLYMETFFAVIDIYIDIVAEQWKVQTVLFLPYWA